MPKALVVRAFLLAAATLMFAVMFAVNAAAQSASADPATERQLNDAYAVALAQKVRLASAAASQALHSLSVKGTVLRTAGDTTKAGTFSAECQTLGECKTELALESTHRTEVRKLDAGIPSCSVVEDDGKVHNLPQHNCWVGTWFMPYLSYFSDEALSKYAFRSLSDESRSGATLHHLQLSLVGESTVQSLSTVDLFVDSTTSLVTETRFNMHPDDNTSSNIPVRVELSDFRSFDGVVLPTHLRRFMQGVLDIELQIDQAIINPTLSETTFSLQ